MKKVLSDSSNITWNNLHPDAYWGSFFIIPENNDRGWSPVQVWPAGADIFQQDTPANTVYFIDCGLVKLTRLEPNGHNIIVSLRRRDWLLGAASAMQEKPFITTATTVTRCNLRSISSANLLNLMKTDAGFSLQLCRMLSKELRDQAIRVGQLGCVSAKNRIENFLCELIHQHELSELKKPLELQLQLKSEELAQLIAVSPEHLCRLLKKMEKQGFIRRDKEMLTITDPISFLRLANM
jgi:CRP/FNR family transcriptional regulator